MSHPSPDPGGKPRLVPFVHLSADLTYTYQCAYSLCTIGCVGDDKCKGVKCPIATSGMAGAPPGSFQVSVSSSSSSFPAPVVSTPVRPPTTVAVATTQIASPPVPEINQLLVKTRPESKPLDPSSPTTKQYMKGISS